MENDIETVVLDGGVATQSFGLGSFVADGSDKSGIHVVKFGGGKRTINYVVPVSIAAATTAKSSVIDPHTAVDPNTLTKTSYSTRLVHLSSAEAIRRVTTSSLGGGSAAGGSIGIITNSNGEAIHVVDSGHQGEMPSSTTVLQDALASGNGSLIATLSSPNTVGAGGDAASSSAVSVIQRALTHSHAIGSVPGSSGNRSLAAAECLRIIPSSLPSQTPVHINQIVDIPCTVTSGVTGIASSSTSSITMAGLNDALRNATNSTIGSISTTLSQEGGISVLGAHHHQAAATLQGVESVVVAGGSHATTLGTLTLSNSVSSMTGTLGTDSDVTLAATTGGSVPVETVSLVNISVPNVELTNSGQLLISQGSLVYAQQGNNLMAVPSQLMASQLAQQATTASVSLQQVEPPKKKKGGWPKGKKRKLDPLKEANAPRKPTSAYTLFLNEQRKKLKEKNSTMHFSEVTKVLGNQWSSMSPEDKQKFFAAAEQDKKRYIDELKAYQQTETYQALIKRQLAKKLKNITGCNGDPLDCDLSNSMLSELQLDDDDPNDLFCRTCDQYFSSVHNKREHIYGKQHLVTLALKLCEIEKETEEMEQQALSLETEPTNTPVIDGTNATAINVTDLTPDLSLETTGSSTTTATAVRPMSEPVNIEQFRDDFIELNQERENEIRELHKHQQETLEFNLQLSKQLKDYEDVADKLESDLKNLKAIGSSLQTQLDGLRMVPTLFGVINF